MRASNPETVFITFQKTIIILIYQLRFLMVRIGFIKIFLIMNVYVLDHHRLKKAMTYRFSAQHWEKLKVLSLFGLRQYV